MPELPDDLKPNDLPLTAEERLEGIAKFLACVLALLTAVCCMLIFSIYATALTLLVIALPTILDYIKKD